MRQMLFTLLSIGIKDKPGIHENSHTVIVRHDCTAMLIDRCYLNTASQNLLTHTHTHTHTHQHTQQCGCLEAGVSCYWRDVPHASSGLPASGFQLDNFISWASYSCERRPYQQPQSHKVLQSKHSYTTSCMRTVC